MNSTARTNHAVELLAPAGDWDCARAAIENGADAIYFGLDCGFNARHRAKNFGIADLPELMQLLRRRGLKGYVTMNTLVFPSELPALVEVIEKIAAAGVDAVLVQDFGVARIVHAVCPELEIHASTQMSLTSAETIEVARGLGISRVVLARELSLVEIRSIAAASDMPLEVFIHGALCVAYSGQCLTSESLGGRSANRGHCAQACRLPYELICDGEERDLEDVRYLLSPQDLAGYQAIPDLIESGVASLKIEGRLKTPEYVANITGHYRRAIEQALSTAAVTVSNESKREMELSFSRGFSPGWLQGNDHKRLVPGLSSAKRGIPLGSVIEIDRSRIKLLLDAPLALGDGLAISGEKPETTQGGRIYSLEDDQRRDCRSMQAGQLAWIGFGKGEIDFNLLAVGAAVFKTDDPQLNKRLRKSFSGCDPKRRQVVDIAVIARTGQPLQIKGRLAVGIEAAVSGQQNLNAARTRPADQRVLREKVARLGGTPLVLGKFTAEIIDSPMVPVGMVNDLRRRLVERLLNALERCPPRTIHGQAGRLLVQHHPATTSPADTYRISVLCRTPEQLAAVLETEAALAYVDFHDIRQYANAVQLARRHRKPIGIATVRMQKPGELGLMRVLLRHKSDLVLARNLAAIRFFSEHEVPVIADFSLNVANQLSAAWILGLGSERITASYDLNRDQLLDLVGSVSQIVVGLAIVMSSSFATAWEPNTRCKPMLLVVIRFTTQRHKAVPRRCRD